MIRFGNHAIHTDCHHILPWRKAAVTGQPGAAEEPGRAAHGGKRKRAREKLLLSGPKYRPDVLINHRLVYAIEARFRKTCRRWPGRDRHSHKRNYSRPGPGKKPRDIFQLTVALIIAGATMPYAPDSAGKKRNLL